jgi:MerR family copper efflux transcriptional regulator
MGVKVDFMSTPIGDAAALFGLPPSTLRWWEREGLVEPVRDRSGRRGYRDAELRRIAIVYLFRNTAMLSLSDIRALMEHRKSGENWQPTLRAHAAALDQQITQLTAARDYLRHLMRCSHEDPMRCPYLDSELRRHTPWDPCDGESGP